MSFRSIQGMFDILPISIKGTKGEYPGLIHAWQWFERVFREQVELYGYGEIRTPLLESTELFKRSIGEATDVVEKEMYAFERHRDQLCLRPEGTASAARAYLQHKVQSLEPVTRWYYIGPMYRAERAQRGRYRQFYQAGCEVFGDAGPASDAELIEMLVSLFERLGISDIEVHLNSLGNAETRTRFREELVKFLTPVASQLSEDSQRRLHKNPLRILDSKAPEDQALLAEAPRLLDLLDDADKQHFDRLQELLTAYGVPFQVDPNLVRGLDYYTRTLFELKSNSGQLGAQNTLCGGGRYDTLLDTLGKLKVPAIGFAMGIERILLALSDAAHEAPERGPSVFVAPLGEAAIREALVLGQRLRRANIRTEIDGRGNSMKSMLRRANHMAARFVVVLGQSELERGVVQVKDFASSAQSPTENASELQQESTRAPEVPLGELVQYIERALSASASVEPS